MIRHYLSTSPRRHPMTAVQCLRKLCITSYKPRAKYVKWSVDGAQPYAVCRVNRHHAVQACSRMPWPNSVDSTLQMTFPASNMACRGMLTIGLHYICS